MYIYKYGYITECKYLSAMQKLFADNFLLTATNQN